MVLLSNLFWCIIGIIGSFLGGLLLYYLGKNRKRISYSIDTFRIRLDNNCEIIDKLKSVQCIISSKYGRYCSDMSYNPIDLKDLYFSIIIIKNIGNTIIDQNDIAPNAPISISTNGKFLLNNIDDAVNIISFNRARNIYPQLKIDETNECNCILLNCDYLEKKEILGCILLHTGDISLRGNLKGGKIIKSDTKNNIKALKFKITIHTTNTTISNILYYR